MTEVQRLAYLQAMGIDVWVSRQQPAGSMATASAEALLGVAPGRASTVVLCATPDDRETPIGRDLARTVETLQGEAPIWAWLNPLPQDDRSSLAELIDGRLLTRVLVLGAGLSECLASGGLPDVIGSAAVVILPDPGDLGTSATARRRAWALLRDGLRGAGPGSRA